jgi:hypothetical protein
MHSLTVFSIAARSRSINLCTDYLRSAKCGVNVIAPNAASGYSFHWGAVADNVGAHDVVFAKAR